MQAPETLDALAIARRVVADDTKPGTVPREAFAVSMLGMATICHALVDATDNPQPVISTALAEAARALIAAEAEAATLTRDQDGYVPLRAALPREAAFLTFKTLFEQEFPNV